GDAVARVVEDAIAVEVDPGVELRCGDAGGVGEVDGHAGRAAGDETAGRQDDAVLVRAVPCGPHRRLAVDLAVLRGPQGEAGRDTVVGTVGRQRRAVGVRRVAEVDGALDEGVVLDLAVRRRPGGPQAAGRGEAEAG